MADRNTKINGNQIKDATVTADELNTSVAGNSITGGAGTALSVQVDNTTIEAVGGTGNLLVKDAGITAAKLAAAVAGNGLNNSGTALEVNVSGAISLFGDAVTIATDAIGINEIDQAAPYSFTGAITSTNVPTGANDVVNKSYVDGVASSLDVKNSVRAASTANVVIGTGGLLTIDGVALVAGDRVLLKDQTNPAENGIYDVAVGAWTRSSDADGTPANEVTSGLFTFVEEGTANNNNGYVLSTPDPITLGTTGLSFTQFSGAGSITAGTGLTKTGNTLDVIGGSGITANVNDIEITPLGVTTAMLANDSVDKDKIAADIAGLGLSQAVGGELDVNVDNVTLNMNIDTLEVKALGITNAHISATAAIADTKLAEDYVKVSEVDEVTLDSAVGTLLRIKALGVDTAQLAASAVTNAKITDGTIAESKLNISNAEGAGLVLSSDGAGGFTWISGTADSIVESDLVKGTYDETVSGVTKIMGTFSGSAPVLSNSVQVFLNGLIQEEGLGKDYTIALATGVVTFIDFLDAGDHVEMYGTLDN